MSRIEYRFNWSASTNISFLGQSDWLDWWGDDELTADEVLAVLEGGTVPDGLQEALEACGFEWSAEVREVAVDA